MTAIPFYGELAPAAADEFTFNGTLLAGLDFTETPAATSNGSRSSPHRYSPTGRSPWTEFTEQHPALIWRQPMRSAINGRLSSMPPRSVGSMGSVLDRRPSRWLGRLFGAPRALYRWRLGWLLGDRFLMLVHVGRRSGREHATVLEVVAHEDDPDVWYVAAAWGNRSDWYRNLEQNPKAEISVRRHRHCVVTEVVDIDHAVSIYEEYVRKHPWAARLVGRVLGIDRVRSDPRTLAERIPLITLAADETSETTPPATSQTRRVTQASYDRIAPFYTALEGFWEGPARAAGLGALMAARGDSVFEVGCGPGNALCELARSVGAQGRAIGIDLSSRMCTIARHRLVRDGQCDTGAVVQADAVRLPFADGTFDAGFMSFTLELFDSPDIPVVLSECQRLLRPQGRMTVVALNAQHPAPLMQRAYEWGHRRFPRLLDCRPIRLEAWMRDAGFIIMHVTERSLWGLPVSIVVGTPPSPDDPAPTSILQ